MAKRKAKMNIHKGKILPIVIAILVIAFIALIASNPGGKFTGISGDGDGDGLTDREEAIWGSDPTVADTDGDGLSDGHEAKSSQTDLLDPRDP